MITVSTAASWTGRRPAWRHAGWAGALVLTAWLSVQVLGPLWEVWRGEASLSHGPLLWLIALALLWGRRAGLRQWSAASPGGMALLLGAAVSYAGAVWADTAFLKPIAFLGMAAGAVWFLGGSRALRACAGPLGLLLFSIPWPTTLVEAVSFPLQLTSSAYAALFAGMLGLPVQRDGVHLVVMPPVGHTPVYAIRVAAECSGLTSLMVLLAVGYLIAYHTPAGWGARAALVAAVAPMALVANAVRLTVILLVGAHYSADLASWVHDHEQPVLVLLCGLGLVGLRQAILAGTRWNGEGEAIGPASE